MTRKQIERIVAEWQSRLGLDLWDLKVNFLDPAGDDAHASMSRSNIYDRGEIRFEREWPKWDQKFANQVVVHELVHLVVRDVEESVKSAGPSEEVSRQQTRDMEQLVDRLANRFVDLTGLA